MFEVVLARLHRAKLRLSKTGPAAGSILIVQSTKSKFCEFAWLFSDKIIADINPVFLDTAGALALAGHIAESRNAL